LKRASGNTFNQPRLSERRPPTLNQKGARVNKPPVVCVKGRGVNTKIKISNHRNSAQPNQVERGRLSVRNKEQNNYISLNPCDTDEQRTSVPKIIRPNNNRNISINAQSQQYFTVDQAIGRQASITNGGGSLNISGPYN
jgi:hypothetical protein